MKRYTVFLLTISTLLFAGYTVRAQSDSVKVLPVATYQTAASVKVLPVATYGMLVEDAVQRRVMDSVVTEMRQRLADMESIQAQIEANLTRQITILSVENQALEIQTAAWESKYDVVEKQLGKKQNATRWLKVAVGAAFVLGVMAGK